MTGSEALNPGANNAAPVRRVGLLGGSFDPVHQGHLALGRVALQQLGLDELRFLPVGQAWQKSRPLSPAADRVAMLALALAEAGEPAFRLDDLEVKREGPTYTVDTVEALQQSDALAGRPAAEWILVIGQDQFANLPTWHRWPDLLTRVTLAVAARQGVAVAPPPALAAGRLPHGAPFSWVRLDLPEQPVSSTAVREFLARGRPAAELAPALVPASVAGYIANHQLFA